MNMRYARLLVLAVLSALIGCASGPKLNSVRSSIPNLSPEQARIYFYRASYFGGAYQPEVTVDGQVVGRAQIEGVYFKDYAPGKYLVSTSLAQGNDVSLILSAGDVKYIRLKYRIGFAVYPELVDRAVGESESDGLSYTGALPTGKK
jgi:Protein of unknown function (DUF2846)